MQALAAAPLGDRPETGIRFLHYTQIKPWADLRPSSLGELHYLWTRWPKRFVHYRTPLSWWRPNYRRALAHGE